MKKLQLLLTALLSIVSAVAMADEVTVSNIEADAGGNAEIVVNLSTAATNITGYQMSLYLPEGVTLQTDADDDYVYTLSGRHHSSHSLSINNQADGGLMLICYSMNKKSIASGDGELLRLPVKIAPAAAGTALEGELRSIKLSDTSSNVTTLPNVSFSITMQYALEAYAIFTDDGTLTFYYDGMKSSRSGTKYELNTGYNDPGWYTDHRTDITTVVFDATFAEARPTSTYRWFAVEDNETSVLTSIEGIEYLNTSSVTTMYYMFKGRSGLTSLDLRSFDTSSVTNMGDMFYGCSGLTSLDLSNFNTSSVTYISYMFYGCSGLTSLDLSSFDTSSVMIMFKMFQGCSGLTSLDLSNFNTSSVRDMGDMFSGCSGLTSLDLSSFDTSSVEDMTLMFWSCRSLTSLDLSNFDTSSVTDMYAMFYGCSGLTSLDLSSFNTSSVTDMQDMFRGCSGLTTIYCGDYWNTDKVTSSSGMFYNCTNLVGGAGTVYNSNYIDKTYAHVDGGPNNPGYLTFKNSSQGGETPVDAEAYVVYNDGTLTFYFDGMKSSRSGTKYELNNSYNDPGWYTDHRTDITTVVFDATFAEARPTSTYRWFAVEDNETSVLTSIEGIEYLNTSNVTSMDDMFYGCSGLTSLDLSSFDTSNVMSMDYMFYGCSGLTSLDLSNFNTSCVMEMFGMFEGCSGLTSLDLSSFDTSSVENMVNMFNGCSGLTSLDLSSFDTSNVTDMGWMFAGCSGLTSLDLRSFDTSSVTHMTIMFDGCSGLTSLDLSRFDTSSVTDMQGMFYGCSSLTTIYCGNDWNTDKVTYSSEMFSNCTNLVGGAGTVYNSNYIDKTYAHVDGGLDDPGYLTFKNSSQGGETPGEPEVYVVYNDGTLTFYYDGMKSSRSGTKYELNNSYNNPGWYTDHRTDITTVVFDATFAEARPTSTYRWFAVEDNETSVLTSIEGIEYLNTSEVTTMRCMFYGCSGLTSLDLRSFDTGSVTYMSFMFSGCSGLTSLDLSSFDTSNVTDMSAMFNGCSGLTSLDLSSFDTSNVTDMGWMFVGCSNLTSLDLSSFNTSSVTDMVAMFAGCSGLTSLDLRSFDTSSVTHMPIMFRGCSGLTSLDLSRFDTSSVTDMEGMFYGCSGLTSLDLSKFNTSSVTDMQGMFYGCSSLTTIYCGNDWNTDKVTSSSEMFSNCTNLVGGAGTVYSSSHTDIAYAHVDGGLDDPGYLTLKGSSQGDGIEVTDVSQIDNVIYVEEMEERNGQQVTLSLMMKNTANIRGFQFDLYLPEGATVVKSAKGKIQGALSAGRLPEEDEHNLTFSEQQDGAIRFLCSSQYDETFTGTEGEIATLQIRLADDMADGDYAIVLKNVKLTETDISKFYLTEEVVSKLTIVSYVTGDINGDGIVDVSDYTGVANFIHGNVPAGFYAKAADVDESGNIDVSDYTGIANIIHTGSVYGNSNTNYASRRSGGENLPDTDVSTIDNVIYISPFTVTAGTQTMLSIKMKNTAAIRGFQFDLYLPEGMTVVKSDKGRIQGALSAGRLPEEDEHDLTFSEQQDGAIRFLCSSQYNETFTGTDGEIATLQVNVADGMADGDYALLLREVKLTETDISKFYLTELVKTTVTVGSSIGVDVVLDETNTEVPEATAGDVTILVKRTIKANEWSTICLPFDMTEAQTKAAFGNGVQLKEFTDYEVEYDTDDNVVGLTVNFDDTDLSEGFYGNYPYLIKVANDIDEFTVTSTIEPVEDDCYIEYDNGRTGKNRKVYGTFKGFYHAQTTVPNNCLFLSGNKFWYSTGQTKMKAFRAYFNFVDVLTVAENASARISMSFDDETTRIVNVNVNDDENYYDLQGRRIAHPQKGLYIKNNKKVVVK